ncbi:2'-5' RNA ligase family protein [Mucilaginibacter sp. UR6-1]|uniref:2'-5' RNA ligase family protein n=1 Tax=Mucilaginibacter sp. UR6-1 TaxID=1435643 RepID=UPI001E2E6ED5|nr:2'-5' RNA ligase family protein [Mucilaginibacter sp. UR6-1]MCC8407621.1 2'-5' RNA ligase family protein [Mucilaginibacter sp. UR6-1]
MHYADYMMLLSPPDEVVYEIERYKKASAKHIGQFKSMHAKAHISICKAERQKTFIIEPTLQRLAQKLSTIPPIVLHIKGFGFFKHGDKSMTIYANVDYNDAVKKWFKLLLQNMNLKISLNPHITVVRNITAKQFELLWPYFAKAQYNDVFKIDALTVLKRDTFGHEQHWQQHKVLPFHNRFFS